MRIFLGSVAWRQIEQGHHSSVVQLFQECARRGIEIREGSVVGDALVSRARSLAASAFLRSDCDVLLSIDSDIWFRPEDAIALCERALAGHDVIGALYMTRAVQTQPAMMLPDEPVIFAAGQPPVETRFVSTGFSAVARTVFERLSETLPHCHQTWRDPNTGADTSFWPFYMPFTMEWPNDGHIYLSEDWAFCQRARDAGFKLWVDPSIRLGHIGSYMYTLEDLVRPARSLPQPMQMQRGLDGKLQTQFMKPVAAAIHSLPRDVAAYCSLATVDELKAALASGSKDVAALWAGKNGQSDSEFYQRDDVGMAYLRDLAAWHISEQISHVYTSNLEPLKGKGLRVLDYGSGIGTSALILAEGNRVTCVEPNARLRDFTSHRARSMGLTVDFVDGKKPLRGYDLAVCFHVLEHVDDPHHTARQVVAALRPGGVLLAESDFTDDGNHPMHLIDHEDKRGEHYWLELGLERLDDYWWRKPNGTAI